MLRPSQLTRPLAAGQAGGGCVAHRRGGGRRDRSPPQASAGGGRPASAHPLQRPYRSTTPHRPVPGPPTRRPPPPPRTTGPPGPPPRTRPQPGLPTALANLTRVLTTAERHGTYRVDNPTIVDVRLEKRFRIQNGHRLGLFLDGFNLTNSNAAEAADELTGRRTATVNGVRVPYPQFMRPTQILNPRIYRFGVKYTF